MTAPSRSASLTLSFTSTLPLASSVPCSKVRIWPMAWRFSGSSNAAGLAISSDCVYINPETGALPAVAALGVAVR